MISKDKQYKTRDGREVRIYATDGGYSGDGVHGSVKTSGLWMLYSWSNVGRYDRDDEHIMDLIEVRPRIKRTVWLNVYEKGVLGLHASKEQADVIALEGRLACVKVEIDCEEGDGL